MLLNRRLTASLACLALWGLPARAETPATPLRFIPEQSDLLFEVKLPRQAVETLERARQESKDTMERGEFQGIPTVRIGQNFFAAIPGSTLLLSNKKDVLKLALDMHLGRGGKSLAESAGVAESVKLLPAEPL